MRRRTIFIDLDGYRSLVRGWGSRELLTELKGRPPVYIRPTGDSRGGWSVQEGTARDLVALAEHRGCDVVITGRRQARVQNRTPDARGADAPPETPAPESEDVLW